MKEVTEGTLLWTPKKEQIESEEVTKYKKWLAGTKGITFKNQKELWEWSVQEIEPFWESIWEYNGVISHSPYKQVLKKREMPNAEWFEGATLNYAEHVFRNNQGDKPAIIFKSETTATTNISWQELEDKTAKIANYLRESGVEKGDRVVAYMPNVPETVAAFLACASIGAIWSVCSPDFGTGSVLERFKQIEPKILFAVDGYSYNGKLYDRIASVGELQSSLPTLEKTILFNYTDCDASSLDDATVMLDEILKMSDCRLTYEAMPFNHPLWVLFSSGTTGLPKPIVQGHGGIILEHLKTLNVEMGINQKDTFFWFTTTGWMMWNLLIGGLLSGSTIVLYNGSPGYPNMNAMWDLAEEVGMTFFGTSAAFIGGCMNAGIQPMETNNLSKLKGIGSTGSPLSIDAFGWVYEHVKEDLWLVSTSGGTDLCTAFVGGSPVLPVYAGELQTRALGANVQAFDDDGNAMTNEVGELVITEPMPSMPLFFWGDENNERYVESYFEMFPGIWRHGDWIKIDDKGSCIIYGRSDSTINRQGVRLGTSEIYRVVDVHEEVEDSLVIDLEHLGKNHSCLSFSAERRRVLN